MRVGLTVPAFAVSVSLFLARITLADEPFTRSTLQLGAGPNYGFYLGDDEEIPDTHGPGAHLLVGYTPEWFVYLGGEFNYFRGASERQQLSGVEVDIAWTMMQFGFELGYDLALGEAWLLRPKLGVGYASVSVDVHADDVLGPGADLDYRETYGGLVLPLGLESLYSLGEVWFAAAKVRYGYVSITVDVFDATTAQKVGEADKNAHSIVLGLGAGARF
jgi:hypothetical protein